MSFYSIGVIGLGSHAKRLIKILSGIDSPENILVFKHGSRNATGEMGSISHSKLKYVRRLEELEKVDLILIATPHHLTFDYLRKLRLLFPDKLIFCEKPLINRLQDIVTLRKLLWGPTILGLPYRFHLITERICALRESYGSPLRCWIRIAYPLLLKNDFKGNWRFDTSKCPLGVIESLGVHYLDMASQIFGRPDQIEILYPDSGRQTVYVQATHGGASFNGSQYYFSYESSWTFEVSFQLEGGLIQFVDGEETISSPIVSIENDRLVKSPIIKRTAFSEADEYDKALTAQMHQVYRLIQGGQASPALDSGEYLQMMKLVLERANV